MNINEEAEYLTKALSVYRGLTASLDAHDWHYTAVEEQLLILSDYIGDDFPIRFFLKIDPATQNMVFRTTPIVTFPKDKVSDGAIAACVANHGLAFGLFDFDLKDGTVCYSLSTYFAGADFQTDFYFRLLSIALGTVDKYNDRFIMLSKGIIDIKQFISLE